MIRISKTIDELKAEASLFYIEVKKIINPFKKLEDKLANPNITVQESLFFEELKDNIKEIITEIPQQLENRINHINILYQNVIAARIVLAHPTTKKQKKAIRVAFKDEVLNIFDYSTFTSYNNGKWAYSHSSALDIKVCPYCNMQYTFTIETATGKTRPHFDHFFDKATYPYLSMSFFNLIPSCYICNSNLKGSKPFLYSTNIHPFFDDIQDVLLFRTGIEKVDYLNGIKNFDIKLLPIKNANPDKLRKAEANVEIFKIEEQYFFHKEYAGEIVNKGYMYTDTKIKELFESFHGLFANEEEIIETLFGNFVSNNKLYKRPLAKLTSDILDEIGIKKHI